MAGKLKGSGIVDASVTEQQLSANINASLALAANVYNQANAAYAQANGATGLAQTAYNQGTLAYIVANTSANTVMVSQNGAGTLLNKRLNFNNTSTITVSVEDVIDGNANISFTSITNDVNTINAIYTQANAAYEQANVVYAYANSIAISSGLTFDRINLTFATVNTAVDLAYTQANNAYQLAGIAFNASQNAQVFSAAAYDQANVAYNTAYNNDVRINVAVYPYINTVYDRANTADTRATNAYIAANNAANTVAVSQNTSVALFGKQINFVNTANIGITLTDAGNGVANIVISGSAGNYVRVANDVTTNVTSYLLFTTTTLGNVLSTNVSTTKLTFNPNTGILSATTFNSLSDERQKDNIETLLNAAEMLEQIRGVKFTWRENGKPSMGIIAQELLAVAPEIIDRNENGIFTVNYAGINAILIEAMKSMRSDIKELRAEIEKLKNVPSIK